MADRIFIPTSDSDNKLINLIRKLNTSDIRELLYTYLSTYPEEFDTANILDIIDDLSIMYLRPRVIKDAQAKFVAGERARYLKRYLEGKMYSSREAAEKYVDIQIENTEAILEACGDKEDEQ